ncbi:MAG TPA: PilZ domain-containing protein [Bryobacteraceae bacterium]|nr:PilZ domain-containing protein [Bryobacteraceae bacterium]
MIRREQRRNLRFEVNLPCELWSPFQAFDMLSGVTVNMSRIGLLFSPDDPLEGRLLPQVGHAARVVLQLPGSGQGRGRCVECLGRVVRLEEQEDSRRIALEFRRYQFTSGAPDRSRT